VGNLGPHSEKAGGIRTAYELKAAHRSLKGLTDDELKQIPILPVGTRQEQGATYIDLKDHDPQEITARGEWRRSPQIGMSQSPSSIISSRTASSA
jgi:hypothetical protein